MQASRRVTESAGWSTESDRIGTREREALALRTQARPEVVINTRPPAAGKTAAPPPPQELAAQPQAAGSGPSHPYAAARDATNATLPQARYNAEPTRQNAQRRPEGGNYSNTAKIYDEQIATDVYNRAMNAPITLTQRELLSLSPEVRAQVADATIRRRVAREQSAPNAGTGAMLEEIFDEGDALSPQSRSNTEHLPAAYAAAVSNANPPIIVQDPYEALMHGHEGCSAEHPIIVADEVSSLRSILPLVDGKLHVEAIVDPGCQVIAMSEEVCTALALVYDPTVKLPMKSANGEIDYALGLARNVPFLIGDITLMLQVHIMRSPAYDILLGRPFDVLTESLVKNFANEDQNITIRDPNTGRKATIPTIQRGSYRFAGRPKPNEERHFQSGNVMPNTYRRITTTIITTAAQVFKSRGIDRRSRRDSSSL
ncbi:hypothetical protein BC834DRAFT_839105 [Gloeopeniophorella convolvens]|nr:hypothetical protein BC834DRAFT_839105 [Gloeopeniophorella convolvens]